jgi:hypothetical protein
VIMGEARNGRDGPGRGLEAREAPGSQEGAGPLGLAAPDPPPWRRDPGLRLEAAGASGGEAGGGRPQGISNIAPGGGFFKDPAPSRPGAGEGGGELRGACRERSFKGPTGTGGGRSAGPPVAGGRPGGARTGPHKRRQDLASADRPGQAGRALARGDFRS